MLGKFSILPFALLSPRCINAPRLTPRARAWGFESVRPDGPLVCLRGLCSARPWEMLLLGVGSLFRQALACCRRFGLSTHSRCPPSSVSFRVAHLGRGTRLAARFFWSRDLHRGPAPRLGFIGDHRCVASLRRELLSSSLALRNSGRLMIIGTIRAATESSVLPGSVARRGGSSLAVGPSPPRPQAPPSRHGTSRLPVCPGTAGAPHGSRPLSGVAGGRAHPPGFDRLSGV